MGGMQKRCSHCKETKVLGDFSPQQQDDPYGWCRQCRAEYRAARKVKFPDEMKAAKKRYAEKFPERVREGKRRRYHKNGDVERAKMRERFQTPEHKEWIREYEEKRRWQRMLRTHGITREAYEAMWTEQDGCCFICRRKFTEGLIRRHKGKMSPDIVRPHIDHCHTSGRVRGILCNQCNAGIGMLGESPENFARAVEYLQSGRDCRPNAQQLLPLPLSDSRAG